MIRGPQYKIARRLGAHLFEKTQTQKFAARAQRKGRATQSKHPSSRTDFGMQLLEKQKLRVAYGISERQFSRYVKDAVAKKNANSIEKLNERLETRLDNVVYRSGFAPTRAGGRQMVSHGHFLVNGKRVTIPSYAVKKGDIISIREGSKNAGIFNSLIERITERKSPEWLTVDSALRQVTISAMPSAGGIDINFNLAAVVEFYSR